MSFRLSNRSHIGPVRGIANVDVPILPGLKKEKQSRELKQSVPVWKPTTQRCAC